MTDSVLGTCYSMCPEKERWMREREGLLHILEIDERTKHLKRPKADPSKVVKCFSRPAAGQLMSDPSELRPAPILLGTIRYLFLKYRMTLYSNIRVIMEPENLWFSIIVMNKVVTRTDFDWTLIYDFVFDRLRAIRQDLVIQRIGCSQSIKILEPIVRFHIYAAQRLCEKEISAFDPKINDQHLLECLKQLLVLYDEREQLSHSSVVDGMDKLSIDDDRCQMEAAYILLHLGDVSTLNRGLSLPKKYRNKDVELAMSISLSWYLKNYVRTCRHIQRLSPLLACTALCNLRRLRSNVLEIMSRAYNSKSLTFPGLKLQEILLYRDIDKIARDCELFGLSFVQQNVRFETAKFKKALLANPEMCFSPRRLNGLLPDILWQNNVVGSETKDFL